MKRLISIIIISFGFLSLMAQNDYYIKQAQSYQREAEYYTKQALGYEREVVRTTNYENEEDGLCIRSYDCYGSFCNSVCPIALCQL